MRQSHMSSNLSANARSILGKQAITPKDESLGTLKDTAIAPHTGRKTSPAHKMHCFEFRELLQAKRQKWVPQVHATIAASGAGLGIGNQLQFAEDYAGAPAEKGTTTALEESQELQEIDAALARLSDGSYGTCIDCGGEIGRARLKTEPTARSCSPCEVRKSPIYSGDD